MILSPKKLLEHNVCSQLKNELLREAFKKVDRKLFVPKRWEKYAYVDSSIPLDGASSISQPSLVAEMIDLLDLSGNEHVLEIGTGSGYSAAILSLCCKEVDTVEIDPKLAITARKRFELLGLNNISVHIGDGSIGIPKKAPFDSIIVTAVAKEIPKALIDQLKERGRIIIPVEVEDSDIQELVLGIKKNESLVTKPITIVKFVPLV